MSEKQFNTDSQSMEGDFVPKSDYLNLLSRFEGMFDGNFDMVYVHDFKGKIIDVNIAASELLGYNKEELLKMNILDLVLPEYHEEIKTVLEKIAIHGSEGVLREFRIKTKSGNILWINTRSNVMFLFKGEPVVQGFAHDVTTRKNYERDLIIARRQAEKSDQLKSSFLANMSHEIRTPLNAILGFADIIANDELSVEEVKKFSSLILDNGEFLMNILSDIIDVAKMESDQLSIKKSQFNLTDMLIEVDSTIKNSHNYSKKKGVKLQISYAQGPELECFTDRVRLKQILFNLINNALKFTSKGHVVVSYQQLGDVLQFRVSDTGSGIDKKYETVIFERFGQADINNPANYSGTGLGLSICKGLVELLGGRIWMESELGVGSDFFFTVKISR